MRRDFCPHAFIEQYLITGDWSQCISILSHELRRRPESPFHRILDLRLENSPEEMAAFVDDFVRKETTRGPVNAVYVELNDFSINPGLWYVDIFSFHEHGGNEEFDWLLDWDSEQFEPLALRGFEELQVIYANRSLLTAGECRDARDICDKLVVAYFFDLIKSSAPLTEALRCPLLAEPHGYDLVYTVAQPRRMN